LRLRAQAELERRKRNKARIEIGEDEFISFHDWLKEVTPSYNWDWPHIRYIQDHLDQITCGELKRLIIEIPPRHGKTECATIRYPVYRLEKNSKTRVLIAAYNQTLSNKFSRRARRIASHRLSLSDERKAVEEWETNEGGIFRAVGIGSGVTGSGFDLIVIDDPVKNREEADSETFRDKVFDSYTNDLYTRQEPGCAIIIIMTRWHQDDLVGRILASDDAPNWTRIRLPAEAESNDPLDRKKGEALCPERFDLAALAKIKIVLGRDYHALYQQSPQPREGGMFKRDWFELVNAVPAKAKRVRWWDKAATDDGGDYTVGLLMAECDGIYYIEDIVRGQWDSGKRDKIVRSTAEHDKENFGIVSYWSEQEPGSGGKDQARAFVKLLAGFKVNTEVSSGSKEVRADPFASQAQAGNVKIKRADWTSAYLSELCDFPSGRYDDQVDCSSGAFAKLALSDDDSEPQIFIATRTREEIYGNIP
jgi:predicted phage terminase large subunit-like protein